jgi:branched-chain amino acid transport system substrate-binding protein
VAIAVSTNDLTGKFCMPTAMSWNYDSYALTHGVARTLVARGLDSWFFLSVDFAFGTALEGSATEAVLSAGGKVLGSVRHPIDAGDFSSYLVAARASGAKVIALASGGSDMTNAVKQAAEFGITQGGQTVVPLLCNLADIHSLGLATAQGMTLMTSFSWGRNEQTRAWSQRFFAQRQAMPTMNHAAVYSAVSHYLRAVAVTGTTDSGAVVVDMRATPVRDVFADDGRVRADGRMVHDMYLVRVKRPAESLGPRDYEAILQTVPGGQAFRAAADAGCPLAKG